MAIRQEYVGKYLILFDTDFRARHLGLDLTRIKLDFTHLYAKD